MATQPKSQTPAWTYLTNHSHVLICLAAAPDLTLREVAERVGITERMVQNIVNDLVADGVLLRRREGRCNRYAVKTRRPLRHAVEAHCSVGDLLHMVGVGL